MKAILKLSTIAAVMSIGLSAPVFAQVAVDPVPDVSTNPVESRDVVTLRELRADCPPGTIRQVAGAECIPEADWDATMWWNEYLVGNTAAVGADPLADATTNPTETGDTDTATQEIQQ